MAALYYWITGKGQPCHRTAAAFLKGDEGFVIQPPGSLVKRKFILALIEQRHFQGG
jgi:hypothetical protein